MIKMTYETLFATIILEICSSGIIESLKELNLKKPTQDGMNCRVIDLNANQHQLCIAVNNGTTFSSFS